MRSQHGEQKLHLKSRMASLGLILTGMISVSLHASAQHLLEGAEIAHGYQAFPHIMQSMTLSATHGQYIASNASNSTGEPGALGFVLGLTFFAVIFFTVSGRSLFKSACKAPVLFSTHPFVPDVARVAGSSSPQYATSPRSWNASTSPQTVPSGN